MIVAFSDLFVDASISVTGSASIELVRHVFSDNSAPKRSLRIDFASDNGGVIFHDTAKLWTEAAYLSFELHNTSGKRREIALRIHDVYHNNNYHDRYNVTLDVQPGANSYRLPIVDIQFLYRETRRERQLDMDNIQEIQLFSLDGNSFSLFLSDLYLISS